MRIYAYGDSNTWGWDPRLTLGGGYPQEQRWVNLLAARLGARVVNAGMPGREIPTDEYEMDALVRSLPADTDVMTVMLGTNDLLNHPALNAESAAERLRALLRYIRAAKPGLPLLVIAPVPTDTGYEKADGETARYADFCRTAAEETGAAFADAGQWKLPLCFDGLHLTEEGHRVFAERLAPRILTLTGQK